MRSRWAVLLPVFLLGVVGHVESLGYWFTAGDTLALIGTSRITSLGDLWTILTKPLMYGTSYTDIGLFYRPVANLTYAFDYWLWGLNPFGYHLTNVLLHGLAAALVVVTVHALTASARAGGLAGVLFAIHPLSVDTVPAISRRQDILLAIFGLLTLWLFVTSYRRDASRRLRLGAAVAYALALLSKETAIVLGPLVFLWAVFQQPSLRRPRAYWRATRDVLPLAGVAVAYLVVRLAVLGGIGGYSRSPSLATMLLMPVKYVLGLVYPAHALGALGDISLALLLALVLGIVVAYLVLLHRERSFREMGIPRLLLVAVAIVGSVAVAAMVVFPSIVRSVLVQHPFVEWFAVGLVFALAASSAVVAALSAAEVFATGDRRVAVFFLAWLVIPLPLFFIGKEFLFRSAYFFVIPLLALLATYLTKFLTLLTENRAEVSGTDAAFALAALALLLPSLAASPLLYTDSGWDGVGDVMNQTMTGVDNRMTETDGTPRVVIEGVPLRVRFHPKHLGEARERTILHPFSVQSWLRLHGHENPVTVRQLRSFRTAPHDTSTTATRREGTLFIDIHYNRRHTNRSASATLDRAVACRRRSVPCRFDTSRSVRTAVRR
jgi:hypothetical protein